MPQNREVDTEGGGRETYVVYLPCVMTSMAFTVGGCLEMDHTLVRLWKNFMYRHWDTRVIILQDVPPPLPW